MNGTTKRLIRKQEASANASSPSPVVFSRPSMVAKSSSHPRRSRAKFPDAEVVGEAPGGVITSSSKGSNPISSASSEPVVRSAFIESHPLNLDFEPEMAPEVHIRLHDDKRSRHAQRKYAQARRWDDDVLPSLIRPFMTFQRERNTGGGVGPTRELCACLESHRLLKIVCVHMECLEDIELVICSHNTAARQLVRRGLFPCSPLAPTLAVSMDMLEFVSELFVNMAPNERAWAASLTKYLKARGHEFATGDSLRRRFANALAHYQLLIRLVKAEMTRITSVFRESLNSASTPPAPALDEKTPIPARVYMSAHNSTGPIKVDSSQERPSAYLESRCSLCFGGSHAAALQASVIVCIDANFQLKRNHDQDRRKGFKGQTGSRDPPVFSPRTVELPQAELDAMAARINEVRPPKTTKAGASRKRKADEMVEDDRSGPSEDDAVEPGMNIPNSVLDSCGNSFIAADGDRIKASTQRFDDTGLMAMLCRHDNALFIANMRTAGEKQYYAFALISALLRDLPQDWTVGLLYDIACQIHRSLLKWDLMPEWTGRIEFGVSVFHAYGHQWTCQLWYHPRKSEMWGLSDGEGCERFWSELRRLIPGLRVTGYHRRLFIIDLQVEHIDQLKQEGAGKWLRDRVLRTVGREAEAQEKLDGASVDYLLDQFKQQRVFQSKPIARQSKTKGSRAIEHILSMTRTVESLRVHLKELTEELAALVTDSTTVAVEDELRLKIVEIRTSVKGLESKINKKTQELHLSDRKSHKELERLKTDRWVNLQLNIRVARDQILAKLRARKFELAGLERADTSRQLDHRTKEHVEKAMKGRVSGIQATLKRYEDIRKEMMKLRGKGGIAKDAYIPPEISSSVYKLDVDEDIWQVPHHEDMANFPDGKVPAWLADKEVRDGIRRAQELVNCGEELKRCKAELSNLRCWSATQYAATQCAFDLCNGM